MKSSPVKWPVYAKLSIVTIGMLAFFFILYIGKEIIVPLIFSIIIAILLNPIVNFLCKKKINRILAITLAVVTAFVILASIAFLIITQISTLNDSIPLLKEKLTGMFDESIIWISNNMNISHSKIKGWINDTKSQSINNISAVLGSALLGIGGTVVIIFLMPVYIFMILFYKPLLLEFISKLFTNDKQAVVSEVLVETKSLVQSYLIGLLLQAAIIATMHTLGLLMLGIQYAVLFGILGALLNFIPYIGGIVATILPMLIAIATKSPIYALWVFVPYSVVQLIDNNYIVPKIVASKVKVNALVSILVVIIGGALWGISGMFLAIPLTALVKVVFDRVEPLKPFGFLIGDNQTEIVKELLLTIKPKKKTSSDKDLPS